MGLTPCPFCVVGKFEYRVTEESQKDRHNQYSWSMSPNSWKLQVNSVIILLYKDLSLWFQYDGWTNGSFKNFQGFNSSWVKYNRVCDRCSCWYQYNNRDTGRSAVELSLYRLLSSRVCYWWKLSCLALLNQKSSKKIWVNNFVSEWCIVGVTNLCSLLLGDFSYNFM